jgi:hypothetical protein
LPVIPPPTTAPQPTARDPRDASAALAIVKTPPDD